MKYSKILAITLASTITLTACGTVQTGDRQSPNGSTPATDAVTINLSDSEITVNGIRAETNTGNNVYIENDIIYYEAGKDFTYGEGTESDAHTAESAAEHTVVHITQPGTYSISGTLSKGQIAVDLGDDAEENPDAVVTLILNGTEITCEVAPAIIFYNVYECGSTDTETASKDVDTSSAGANVIIADGTQNSINGSYVARIYKPDSVVLNDTGTEVEDAKKLHKYDAAFYSKMSMNVNGEIENSGILTINADNEGLDSELHLTINGGIIYINAGNDGINTNEDGISVTTINGGELHIQVNGETGEGDGIDSNGWLVINGGLVTSQACGFSADSGIDSDMGIHINGGTVIASGNMLDRISESNQTYAVLNFSKFLGAGTYRLKNADTVVFEKEIDNSFTSLIISSPQLVEGDYTLWYNDTQLVGATSENIGMMFGGGMSNFPTGEMPEGMTPPEGREEPPEGFDSEKMKPEGGMAPPPDDFRGGRVPGGDFSGNLPHESMEVSEIFTIQSGENYFRFIDTTK